MKKTYIAPALHMQRIQTEHMVATSITGIGGNSGIGLGGGSTPGSADSKGSGDWNIWGGGSAAPSQGSYWQ